MGLREQLVLAGVELRSSECFVEDSIDTKWVSGIRGSWKKLVKQTISYKGRVDSAPDMHRKRMLAAAAAALNAMDNVSNYVRRLRDDLLINKGLWAIPSASKKDHSDMHRLRTKVIIELDAAENAILDAISRINHTRDETGITGVLGYKGMYYSDAHESQERFDRFLRSFGVFVDEGIKGADAVISGRLLRALSKIVKDFGGSVDFGGYAPEVVKIGRASLVFQDRLEGGKSPSKLGTQTSVKGGSYVTKLSLLGRGDRFMHPRDRGMFIDGVRDALVRLRGKRLDKLLYGVIYVKPKGYAPKSLWDPSEEVAGEHYRMGGKIVLYGTIQNRKVVTYVLLHELGHRYYYKHMTHRDRVNFGRWFGVVPAATEYGGLSSSEDFAEVFVNYIMNQNLTKDQRERFKQFMTGMRPRTERKEVTSVTSSCTCEYCDQPVTKVLVLGGGGSISVCNGHVADGRRQASDEDLSVVDVRDVQPGLAVYREHTFIPEQRFRSALRPALEFVPSVEPGTYFGLRGCGVRRRKSAFQEASVVPVKSRKNVIAKQKDADSNGGDLAKKEVPSALLKMLGQDWRNLKARRVHANRVSVDVDGVKYTLYTRKG